MEEAGHVRLETEARRSASEGRSLSKLPPDPPGLRRTPDPSSSGSHQTHTTFLAYISQVEKSLLIPYVGVVREKYAPLWAIVLSVTICYRVVCYNML